jgi:hypothetical protein
MLPEIISEGCRQHIDCTAIQRRNSLLSGEARRSAADRRREVEHAEHRIWVGISAHLI